MSISHYIKEIGRGKDGARSLTREQATDLFGRRGVEAVSLDVIAAEVGVAKQTLLYWFPSKDDLVRLTPLLDPDQPTGLDYYPLSQPGERFPINDPGLEPRLQPRPADDRLFFQAMLEGIAAIEATAYRKLAELGASSLTSIRNAGGGAANPAWTRIRLRALGVPARSSLSEHAAVGTARLAWRGIGHAN